METNKQDNLWDSDEYYQGKNEGAMMVTLGVVGKGCHRVDRKVPFMPTVGGRELWAAGSYGFMALNSAASLCLLKRRQQ